MARFKLAAVECGTTRNGILGISSGARSVAAALHFPTGNSAKGPAVAPCVVFSCQTVAVRDSQHRRAIVHVHRSRRIRQWLILILVNQRDAPRTRSLNRSSTAR